MSASKNLIQAAAGVGGGDFYPYTIDNSIRTDGSSYMSRTFGTSTNQYSYTLSFWMKVTPNNSDVSTILSAGNVPQYAMGRYLAYGHQFAFQFDYTTNAFVRVASRQRDVSAWYHILAYADISNSTASERIKIYINGELQTLENTTYPTQSMTTYVNGNSQVHNLFRTLSNGGINYSVNYWADIAFVDGTALTPSSFGETKNGVWVPKDLSSGINWGNNGFWLKFNNASNLGEDSSGNGNGWSVTGFTSSDQMIDTPTNNFPTLNPLSKGASITLSEGNLKATSSTSVINNALSTLATPSSGTKVYWELTVNAVASSLRMEHGGKSGHEPGTNYLSSASPGFSATFYEVAPTNTFYFSVNGSNVTTLSSITPLVVNDVVQYAYDPDTGKIWVGRNGTWLNSGNPSAGTGNVGTLTTGLEYNVGSMLNASSGTQTVTYNFGQSSFAYTPPTDFVAMSTANLPEPTIGPNIDSDDTAGLPEEQFSILLYEGNSTNDRDITGVGFDPDLGIFKNRDEAYGWIVVDRNRGDGFSLGFDTGAQESGTGKFDSFITDGYRIDSHPGLNRSSIVNYSWKAGGTASSNTDGTITSNVSVNTDAKISIVTYTGVSGSASVGHGLGVKPDVKIVKVISTSGYGWYFFSERILGSINYGLDLSNNTALNTGWSGYTATDTTTTINWGSTNFNGTNASGYNFVAYCFAEVEGFSKFGSYTGNGSTDGPFIFTGMRPAFIIIRETGNVNNWMLFDNKRLGYNVDNKYLLVETSATEGPGGFIDILSNGFKCRSTATTTNRSGGNYIYIAFAENPFKYSNAR